MPKRQDLVLGTLLTALVAFGAISNDLYLPAMPEIGRYFSAEAGTVQLTFSLFLAGFAVAQLAYGPLSDRFGRRPVLIAGLAIYFLASLACMVAQSVEQLIAARFLMALGACAGPVLGRAIVRDIFGPDRAAKALSYIGTVMGLIPAVAPTIGGFVTGFYGWRANFVVLAVFSGAVLVATVFLLKESNRWRNPDALKLRSMAGTYRQLLCDRVYMGYTLAMAFGFAGLTSFVSNASYVLIDGMQVAVTDFGYYFAAVVLGFMLGTLIGARLTGRFGMERTALVGTLPMIAGAGTVATLAYSGVATPLAVVLPTALLLVGVGILFPNALAAAISPFQNKAGSASAMLGFIQMGTGAATSIVTGYFHDGTPRSMATGMILGSVLALLCMLVVRRTRRAREAAPVD